MTAGVPGVSSDLVPPWSPDSGPSTNEMLRHIANVAPCILYIYDLEEHRNLWGNREMTVALGYTQEEMEAMSDQLLKHLYHPEDLGRYSAHRSRLMQLQDGETAEFEYRLRHADGSWRWLQSRDTVFRRGLDARPRLVLGAALDITDRRKAEESVRENEEQFRAMFTVASVGKAQADPFTGRLLRVNGALCKITGYSETELLTKTIQDLTHPEDREADWQLLCDLVKRQGEGYENEKRYVRKDGKIVWVHVNANLIFDARGRPLRTTAIIQDITARKLTEQRLRETLRLAEERARILDTVFEHVPEGITLAAAPDARILRVSQHGVELTGKPADALEGIRIGEHAVAWSLYKPNSGAFARDEDLPLTRATIKGEVVRNELWDLGRPDGSRLHILCNAAPIRDDQGNITGGLVAWRDVTELHRAEQALRESEAKLRLAKEAADLGIHEYDPASGTIIWDQRVRDFWGLPENVSITYESFLAGLHPADRVPTQQAVTRALDPSGDGRYYAEYRVVSAKDKVTRWVAVTGTVLFKGNKPTRLVGTVQDITRQKDFQGELERLVNERTAKLNELVGELEHFSYTITHDMRAPLRSMRGFAELTLELCATCQCQHSEQKNFLRRIISSAERMDLLITDALAYSQTVRQHLVLGQVDLHRLIRGMLDSYPEFRSEAENIVLEGSIPLVLGNQAGLTQVFSNLIGNALKFHEPGQPPKIRIWAEAVADPDCSGPHSSGWIRIWVEDNGIGISATLLPRIFNMFARGRSGQAGTGIGLALVRKIVDQMGGRVGVESQEGKGSRFWIELLRGDVDQSLRLRMPTPPPRPGAIL